MIGVGVKLKDRVRSIHLYVAIRTKSTIINYMFKIEKLGLDYAGHLAPYPFLMTIIFYINI